MGDLVVGSFVCLWGLLVSLYLLVILCLLLGFSCLLPSIRIIWLLCIVACVCFMVAFCWFLLQVFTCCWAGCLGWFWFSFVCGNLVCVVILCGCCCSDLGFGWLDTRLCACRFASFLFTCLLLWNVELLWLVVYFVRIVVFPCY